MCYWESEREPSPGSRGNNASEKCVSFSYFHVNKSIYRNSISKLLVDKVLKASIVLFCFVHTLFFCKREFYSMLKKRKAPEGESIKKY